MSIQKTLTWPTVHDRSIRLQSWTSLTLDQEKMMYDLALFPSLQFH